jgi:hypothetical protein
MNVIKRKSIIYLIVIVMLIISTLFTVKVYMGDANNLLDKGILASMGICLELAKIVMIPIVIKFKKDKRKLLTFCSSIILFLLIGVSIYSNYQYTKSINNNRINESKIVTQEYKSLEDSLKESLKDKKIIIGRIKSLEDSLEDSLKEITKNTNEKTSKTVGITNIYKIKSLEESFNENIKTLNEGKENIIGRLEESKKSLKESLKDEKQIIRRLSKTPKYSFKKTSSFSNNNVRILLGILFELIAISLYFIDSILKADNIKSIDNKVEIIKVEPIIEKKEIKKIEPLKIVEKNNVIEIDYVKQYLKYIKKNTKEDGSIPSDSQVIKETKLTQYLITKAKKELYNDDKLKKVSNFKIILK